MEKWDAYNSKFEKIEGMELSRDEAESLPDGVYHLVCDILVKHKDGSYLLTKRDERKKHGGMWEASAGGSALIGENARECAARELKEETGIDAGELSELGTVINDDSHAIYVGFLCVTNRDKRDITLQEGETVDFKWVSREELFSMDRSELITYRILEFI